jgi:hypothetical protein
MRGRKHKLEPTDGATTLAGVVFKFFLTEFSGRFSLETLHGSCSSLGRQNWGRRVRLTQSGARTETSS